MIGVKIVTSPLNELEAPNLLGSTLLAPQTGSSSTSSIMRVGRVPVRCLLDCGSATSSMQSSFYSNNFGSRDELEHTGEVAVAFNGATSPIWGTFNTEATFQDGSFPYCIQSD